VVIRGVTTGGFTNPTVGVVINDVPYGSSTLAGGGKTAPDIDPSDLARIEVLRGPQGTLYGASSMGGLLKFVTVDPTTERLAGQVQAGISSTHNGNDPAYNASGAVNVPVGEQFAVRASAFTRQDAGYIDNVPLNDKGVNEGKAKGGRLAALWRPTEDFSLKLNAMAQDLKLEGSQLVVRQPESGDLEQQNVLPDVGGYHRKVQAYDATMLAKLGAADLTSVSGYTVNRFTNSGDLGPFGAGVELGGGDRAKTQKFTEEVRVAMPLSSRVDWLLGGFYSHEKDDGDTAYILYDANTAEELAPFLIAGGKNALDEYAVFTDFTFHLTDRFDFQVGARESRIKQESSPYNVDPVLGRVYGTGLDSTDHAFTYLLTPSFKLLPNLMVYARVASGYRPGGPNLSTNNDPTVPLSYAPDKTSNYELGLKGTALDRTVSFDASLYYIDWKDVQLQVVNSNFIGYFVNGTQAKSEGVELSLEARPLSGMTISAWVAWNEAELTEDFPSTQFAFGEKGDRLPLSSRFSGSVSLEQSFPLTAQVSGFVSGSISYVGDRTGLFTRQLVGARQELPAYAKTDLLAGVRYDSWTANVFVNNLTDRRGLLSGGVGTTFPTSFNIIQPRTIGLSVAKDL
jgi:outer membrane receptor protein involved in Fe transport